MAQSEKMLRIGEVAAKTGATPSQLREWEAEGLLHPQRTGERVANDRRLYSQNDVETVYDILLFREMDVGLAEIKQLLQTTKENRTAAFAAISERLDAQRARVQQRIAIANAVEVFGVDEVRERAASAGGAQKLAASLCNDANLEHVARWLRSHTERDAELFRKDMLEVARGFAALPDDATWEDAELQVARFCDMWSTRFGWPTVGELLDISALFDDANEWAPYIDMELGEGSASHIGFMLYLAWVSAGLECLDAILNDLFSKILLCREGSQRGIIGQNYHAFIVGAASTLLALVCESAGRPHLLDMPEGKQRTTEMNKLINEVFDAFKEAALDENLDQFLDLDVFPAVDGSTLEMARELALAFAKNPQQWDMWGTAGVNQSVLTCFAEWESTMSMLSGYSEGTEELWMWITNWMRENYSDLPEARWATDGEACKVERRTREAIEKKDSLSDL